jgi:tRNA-dihydrouridine synthase B
MNVILAPMSGVSDLPFRRLVKKLGAGLVISEMIASQAMVRNTRQTMRMVEKCAGEVPAVVQIAGCDPDVMAEAAKLNEDMGAHIIDINFGCPMKKIVNNYAGSHLMRDETLACKILESVVKAVPSLPVTLKMRTGWDDKTRNAPALAKRAEDIGIQMITIHGRTRCQLYTGKADWEFISKVKNTVSIPVIGNGDVKTPQDAQALLEKSHADGVMVGRGTYGRPWLINQVHHYLTTGKELPDPSLKRQLSLIEEHLSDIFEHYGDRIGVGIARKHLAWYGKRLEGAAHFRADVNMCETPKELVDHTREFYGRFL